MSKFVFIDPKEPLKVWWPVKISAPMDGGTREEQEFEARFVVISDEEYLDALRAGGVLGVLKSVVCDWKLENDKGDTVAFDRFEELVRAPYVRDGLSSAYRDLLGRGPEKN